MSPRLPAALLLALAACGDNTPVDELDGGVVAPDGGVTVELTIAGAEYLVYRDADGPWTAPVSLGDDRYELRVTNAYQYLAACDGDDHQIALLRGVTVADGVMQFDSCYTPQPQPPEPEREPRFQVTTSMTRPGLVLFDDVEVSDTAPWDVTLDVRAGTHDLVALADEAIVVRRGVEVTGDATLPTIDVDAEGAVLESLTLTVADLEAGVTFEASAGAVISGWGLTLPSDGAVVRVPPASVLAEGESISVGVSVRDDGFVRSASTRLAGTPPAFSVLARPTGLVFDLVDGSRTASWSSFPVVDFVQLLMVEDTGISGMPPQASVVVTGSWLEATGATELGFVDLPEDFDPAWLPDLEGPHRWWFDAAHDDGAMFRSLRASGDGE